MATKGLSERRALSVVGMSASALRYSPRPDRNVALREKIVTLAHRHRRYGVSMIHLKLCQDGEKANYKRVERLHRLAQLQVRRRKRKKGSCRTAAATGASRAGQRGMVDGLRFRPHSGGPGGQMPDDRR